MTDDELQRAYADAVWQVEAAWVAYWRSRVWLDAYSDAEWQRHVLHMEIQRRALDRLEKTR